MGAGSSQVIFHPNNLTVIDRHEILEGQALKAHRSTGTSATGAKGLDGAAVLVTGRRAAGERA